MNLEKLSKRLVDDDNADDIVSKISLIEMSKVQEQSANCVPILQRCLKFLQYVATNRNYNKIPPVLKFVRKANMHDDWLVAASNIILPQLNNLYCTILAEADPGTHQSPGKVNVAISSRVKKDKSAMRALCSVFEVCVGFCDLVDDDNQQHLGIFLRSSAAVLFGSDFQKERDTLNETDYAMDELARYSSYALSNIMLTYPAVITIAESILAKRLHSLFKFLHSSPELSINRSLILMLRSLYQGYELEDGNLSKQWRGLIDEEFSCSQSGRRSVLDLFKTIDLSSEDAASQAENVSLKMYSGSENECVCFKTVDCSIQVKERPGEVRRRVPFRNACVDWNRNSFVIHREAALPEYWPLFLISDLDWKKDRRELHLQLEGRPGKGDFGIVIRFRRNSVSNSKKVIIENRIRQTMENVELQAEHKREDHVSKIRKISQATMRKDGFGGPSTNTAEAKPEADHSNSEEYIERGSKLSTRVREKHIFSENPPHKAYTEDPPISEDSEAFYQTSQLGSDFEGEDEQQVSSDVIATERNRNGPSHSDSTLKEVGSHDLPVAVGQRGPEKSILVEESLEKCFLSEGSVKRGRSKAANNVSASDGDSHVVGENPKNQDFELTGVAGPSSCENEFFKSSRKSRSNGSPRSHLHLSVGVNDKDFWEVPVKTVEMKAFPFSAEAFEDKGLSNELSAEDEGLRRKLQTIIKNMLKWKQKQNSQVLRETKVEIKNVRDHCARQDRELVTKLANAVRKRSSLHMRKLTKMENKMKEVLLKTRKRLCSVRNKLKEGQEMLKVLKTRSNAEIASARELMKKERQELATNLDNCIANTRRRSESRARKNSVLQSLARLLKEG